MQAITSKAAQRIFTNHRSDTALALMTTLAVHLARRRTTPPRRQSRSDCPKCGWSSSQASSRGELRAAAHAATSRKGTVGITGKKMPTTPSARLITATVKSNQRSGAGSGGGPGKAEASVAVMCSGGTLALCRYA